MSWLSDYLRKSRIPRVHGTRRHLSRQIAKHGFEVGEYTYGQPHVINGCFSSSRLTIGSYCSIGPNVEIILGAEHRTEWLSTYPFDQEKQLHSKGDVTIGSDVWIGSSATILSGVTIGHGAIIGARAVVSKDVPDYAIVVGNPAKLVRKRFGDNVIAALLETKWWNLPHEKVLHLAPTLQDGNPEALLAALGHSEHRTDVRE